MTDLGNEFPCLENRNAIAVVDRHPDAKERVLRKGGWALLAELHEGLLCKCTNSSGVQGFVASKRVELDDGSGTRTLSYRRSSSKPVVGRTLAEVRLLQQGRRTRPTYGPRGGSSFMVGLWKKTQGRSTTWWPTSEGATPSSATFALVLVVPHPVKALQQFCFGHTRACVAELTERG